MIHSVSGRSKPPPQGEVMRGEDRMETGEAVAEGVRRKVGLLVRLGSLVRDQHVLGLVDQGVVSGTNFLTTVLIARTCNAGELGVYSLGFSLLVVGFCVQEALIAAPYTIQRHRPQNRWGEAEYAGSALLHQGLLSVLVFVLLGVMAAALSWASSMRGLVATAWALVGTMPFALFREFGRRFAFAHFRMGRALVLDLAVSAVQLAGLVWLASAGVLSATSAFVVIGVACTLVSAAWLYLVRGRFDSRWELVGPSLRHNWSLGKWLFASQGTTAVQAYFIHWLLAWRLGPAATGAYAACMTVVLFSNPLILGISNTLIPRGSLAYSAGGAAALWRVVGRTTIGVGAAMGLFCVTILAAGKEVLELVYHSNRYQGYSQTLAVLALATLASAVGMPASSGLTAAGRPDVNFKVNLLAVLLSGLLATCLVGGRGVTGAALGFLAGNTAAVVVRWLAFAAYVWCSERPPIRAGRGDQEVEQGDGKGTDLQATVLQVLRKQQLSKDSDPRAWVIHLIAEGYQARILTVRRQDGQAIWQTCPSLVVKLYRPNAQLDGELVRRQAQSLARLHDKLHGITVKGWQIHVPAVVSQCEGPPALVMTPVPGRSLYSCLKSADQTPPKELDCIAGVVVAALEMYWSDDSELYGDLNFDNILCDATSRSLAFVDPGYAEDSFRCETVNTAWYPASRDLAYLLFNTERVTARRTLQNPAARQRLEALAEGIVRAFLKKIVPAEEASRLLQEIQHCAQAHVNRIQDDETWVSWSPRWLWRWLLGRIVTHRIGVILARLRAEAPLPEERPDPGAIAQ